MRYAHHAHFGKSYIMMIPRREMLSHVPVISKSPQLAYRIHKLESKGRDTEQEKSSCKGRDEGRLNSYFCHLRKIYISYMGHI